MPEWLATILEITRAVPLLRSSLAAVAIMLPFLGAIMLLEWRHGSDLARYRSTHFASDVIHALFYRGGFYNVLIFAGLSNAIRYAFPFLDLRLLPDAPLWLSLTLFWVGGDFLLYWIHRTQHNNRVLWAFHTIHHSQERLTTLTQYRRHPLDRALFDVVLFVVFAQVLGLPSTSWLPLFVLTTSLQALQHADLDWRFGPFYRVVVSPAFHAVHHSTELHQQNANFGAMLSAWDFLFGTAAADRSRPARFGVDGAREPERILEQLWSPFRILLGRGKPASADT
jgi:sterol desaturase/sphingolipid hydroxylase (fatty acid hydroxylase superfamily)